MQDLLIETLKRRLSRHTDRELDLILNENRTIMLSLREKRRKWARLSIHRMFLDAPDEVLLAVADFIEGGKRNCRRPELIRGFIQSNLQRFNYAHVLARRPMVTAGKVYDLAVIYKKINETYFDGQIDIAITWYGRGIQKRRSRIIFGEYYDHLKLIKINRLMDDRFFPDYFVNFIVYHEMLHHVIPGFLDKRGCFRSHGREFKEREVLFKDYERAIAWEKENKDKLFRK